MDDLTDEERFFHTHGVGDYAVEPVDKDMDYLLDKTQATFKEREFVRHMITGSSQKESYLKVYDSEGVMGADVAGSAASRLIKRKRVKEYYFQLMSERDKLAEENLPKLMAELNEDRKLARDVGQPSAAIAAVKAKANLLGLENQPQNTNLTLNIMSDEVKDTLLDRIAERHLTSKKEQKIIDADFTDVTDND